MEVSNANQRGKIHPTQKPVALLEYLIKTYTQEGETVLDFIAGSFSTGVACVNTNRKFIGIEMDENYFNIGVNRILNHKKTRQQLSHRVREGECVEIHFSLFYYSYYSLFLSFYIVD